jgi:hypothetical protein
LVVILSVGLAEGDSMRTEERRDSGQNDLFRARLDQIVDLDHALAKLGRAIDWRFLEKRFGAVYYDKAGQPPAHGQIRSLTIVRPKGPTPSTVEDGVGWRSSWRDISEISFQPPQDGMARTRRKKRLAVNSSRPGGAVGGNSKPSPT